MEIKKVGVVGCGLMGSGIAQVCAQSGYETVVSEVNEELLNKGLGTIKTQLARSVQKGRLTKEDEAAILGRLKGTTKLSDFNDCDLVIEAIIEKMELKRQVFSELDRICPKHAILASNTSCLSIIEMAAVTQRASQVLGMHFFNPVPVMKPVELVRTIATSEETMNTATKFSKSLGKEIVIARDTPGFIVNLLLIPFMLDAIRALDNGLASKEDIDTGIRLGLNHPMGPLTLLDFVGLDTTYYIACAMYEEFKDPKFAPPPLLKQMVTAGWLGRKTGKGFYDYGQDK
ncbi:MAG: 3-hydroxyacyl-CoA dehydrogenase family protein [Dehalococcoidia bacterium]|nr:3-hydroxybutyryl-CoA dehydrogenase [Chloroflexota bacterium]MBT9159756.1 3-hydroxybutyryl-CoA dehydrogenase [Chloroflexota bacterium]MBT9161764.1 3-hydroxybutyryl-CoA dehydrogenase [Chloroflexota bacterium]